MEIDRTLVAGGLGAAHVVRLGVSMRAYARSLSENGRRC
jgi:hypothetical protein